MNVLNPVISIVEEIPETDGLYLKTDGMIYGISGGIVVYEHQMTDTEMTLVRSEKHYYTCVDGEIELVI